MAVIDLAIRKAKREKAVLLVYEADTIEAWYGRNLYSDYLRTHGQRPPRAEAETMARLMQNRVNADDGQMYPLKAALKHP